MSEHRRQPSHEHSSKFILVVATGGSSGLGFQALVDFAQLSEKDIILVLGCRTPTNPTVSDTFTNIPRIKKLDITFLDLVDLESTRAFATHILRSYPQQISVLLLCGAALYSHHLVDQYGNEKTLQTNVLSQALLLWCLRPRLADPDMLNEVSPRIVFVGSSLHKGAAQTYRPSPSTIESILAATPWKPKEAYALSKLVQMHLSQITVDWFGKITGGKNQPTVVVVCPGFVPQTGLIRDLPWWIRFLMVYVMPMMPFTTSLERAGQTIVRAMQDQSLKSGDYITPHGSDSPAPECMDLNLRLAWNNWFISKEVWAEKD